MNRRSGGLAARRGAELAFALGVGFTMRMHADAHQAMMFCHKHGAGGTVYDENGWEVETNCQTGSNERQSASKAQIQELRLKGGRSQMTDTQILTLALAAIIPLSLLIYSNRHVTEAKKTLRVEFQAMHATMRAGFENLDGKFKVHELKHYE